MVPASGRNRERRIPRGGLILPAAYVIHKKPPKYLCTLCDAKFTEDERFQYERHVMKHPIEDVLEHSPRHHAPGLFHPDAGDAEWSKWIRDHAAAGADPMVYMRTDDGKRGGGTGDGA